MLAIYEALVPSGGFRLPSEYFEQIMESPLSCKRKTIEMLPRIGPKFRPRIIYELILLNFDHAI